MPRGKSLRKKRKLPHNYISLTQKALEKEGITLKTMQIKDVIRGKIKKPDLVLPVFRMIKKIEREHLKVTREIKKLKG